MRTILAALAVALALCAPAAAAAPLPVAAAGPPGEGHHAPPYPLEDAWCGHDGSS